MCKCEGECQILTQVYTMLAEAKKYSSGEIVGSSTIDGFLSLANALECEKKRELKTLLRGNSTSEAIEGSDLA